MRICANELNSDPSREDRVDSGKTQHTLHKSSTLQIQTQVKSIINEKVTRWEHQGKESWSGRLTIRQGRFQSPEHDQE